MTRLERALLLATAKMMVVIYNCIGDERSEIRSLSPTQLQLQSAIRAIDEDDRLLREVG